MAVIVGQGISVSPVPDAKLSHESTGTVQNKAVADAIAAEYSTSKTYSVGDVCTYDGKLYECIVDIPTAEGWTLAHWKVSNLGDVASDLNRQLSDVHQVVTVTLTAAGWSSNQQVATVTGVLADVTKQMISPIPAPASEAAYVAAGVMAISQAADALTFRCVHVPTADLTVYVFIDEVVTANA